MRIRSIDSPSPKQDKTRTIRHTQTLRAKLGMLFFGLAGLVGAPAAAQYWHDYQPRVLRLAKDPIVPDDLIGHHTAAPSDTELRNSRLYRYPYDFTKTPDENEALRGKRLDELDRRVDERCSAFLVGRIPMGASGTGSATFPDEANPDPSSRLVYYRMATMHQTLDTGAPPDILTGIASPTNVEIEDVEVPSLPGGCLPELILSESSVTQISPGSRTLAINIRVNGAKDKNFSDATRHVIRISFFRNGVINPAEDMYIRTPNSSAVITDLTKVVELAFTGRFEVRAICGTDSRSTHGVEYVSPPFVY